MTPCILCDEPILPGEQLSPSSFNGKHVHHECGFRAVGGSAAHIERRCSCYVPGSECTDDPALTLRQAAKASWAASLKARAFSLPISIEQATGLELKAAERGICAHCLSLTLDFKYSSAGYNWRQCRRCLQVFVTDTNQATFI